jgi:Fe-S-cluster containining protein
MQCRENCGACCIAPSINRPFVGMPSGKPAGVRCVHLDDSQACMIFDDPRRPSACAAFTPSEEVCGRSAAEAIIILDRLELASRPSPIA